jgi:hypothetical protein
MAPFTGPSFPHRRNPDGTYDSICTLCLATVATAQWEEQLYPRELAHVCDPTRRYEVTEGSGAFAIESRSKPPNRASGSD